MPVPTYPQMYTAAFDIIRTLEKIKVEPAFFGSMACILNGCERWPNDLDIICQKWSGSQEDLKKLLCTMNKQFYLVRSKNPAATYKVLWYRMPNAFKTSIKVDVLLPDSRTSNLELTPFPSSAIERHMSLPCVPISYLLLYKIQGWVHHNESSRSVDNLKVPADVTDIKGLLEIVKMRQVKPLAEPYFDKEFVRKTRFRISRFTYEHPETKRIWWEIGYNANS